MMKATKRQRLVALYMLFGLLVVMFVVGSLSPHPSGGPYLTAYEQMERDQKQQSIDELSALGY